MFFLIDLLQDFFAWIASLLPSGIAVVVITLTAMLIVLLLLGSVLYVAAYAALYVAASWKLLKAAGEKGAKGLIPFYKDYLLFKHSWNTTAFWVYVILLVGAAILLAISDVMGAVVLGTWIERVISTGRILALPYVSFGTGLAVGLIYFLIAAVLTAVIVIKILFKYHLSRAYGHKNGYFYGLVFFWPIFYLMLGFDSGLTYVGDEYTRNAPKTTAEPEEDEFGPEEDVFIEEELVLMDGEPLEFPDEDPDEDLETLLEDERITE